MILFLNCHYLPHRRHSLLVSLCPGMFLVGTALELHCPVSRSGLEDMAKPYPQSDQGDTSNLITSTTNVLRYENKS